MMRGILFDCYEEMVSRKIGIIFGVITVLASLTAFGMSDASVSLTMDGQSSTNQFAEWGMNVLDFYFTILGAFAVFAVAGLFPAMMQKGRADFYLSKPISRPTLFTHRFMSIFAVYGGLIFLSGVIAYAVFAFSVGVSSLSFLWVSAAQFVVFFVWLAIVTLAGVLFNSGGIAIMLVFFVWLTQFVLQFLHNPPDWVNQVFGNFFASNTVHYLRSLIYFIIPKTTQIGDIGVNMASNAPIGSWMPLWSSALFALCAFWLALILFRRKDY